MPQIAYWACWERRIGGGSNMQDAQRPESSRLSARAGLGYGSADPVRAPGSSPAGVEDAPGTAIRVCARRVARGARRRRRAGSARDAPSRAAARERARRSRASFAAGEALRRRAARHAASTRSTAIRRARSSALARGPRRRARDADRQREVAGLHAARARGLPRGPRGAHAAPLPAARARAGPAQEARRPTSRRSGCRAGRCARASRSTTATPSRGERRKIRADPPNVLITTPDMLHLGLLPHHESWSRFFRGLRLVVLDELHTYRGVFGSHVAQVMRRLDRVARHHGARAALRLRLGHDREPGRARRQRHGPRASRWSSPTAPPGPRATCCCSTRGGSPYTAAARLFRLAVRRGLRTIAFTKARRVTELLHTWVQSAEPALARAHQLLPRRLPARRAARDRAQAVRRRRCSA